MLSERGPKRFSVWGGESKDLLLHFCTSATNVRDRTIAVRGQMKTLRHAAGELLVVGLSGTELTGLERAWLGIVRPGGIILFRRNIQDAEQTRGLLDAATGVCAPHAFRMVDLEGGTVDRLRDALAPMPSAQAVFRAARAKKKPAWMREHGELAARAVRAFGFN